MPRKKGETEVEVFVCLRRHRDGDLLPDLATVSYNEEGAKIRLEEINRKYAAFNRDNPATRLVAGKLTW